MSTTGSFRIALAGAALITVSACSSLGGAGPSTGTVLDAPDETYSNAAIQVIELDQRVAGSLNAYARAESFAQVFGDSGASPTVIGRGDVLDIAIWEAPPAVLFGAGRSAQDTRGRIETASQANIPQQQVGEDGNVTVPFVGRVLVAGLRPDEVEARIVEQLAGRANDPQVVVRLVRNESRTVTVLGKVASSGRVVLSARGERLLDAIASAGGTSEAIEQSTVQLTRGQTRAIMPLERVIEDPLQNVRLKAEDVIAVQHQPFSFVALGAVARNSEVPFEGGGVSLAEALGRVGGLNDRRADIKGVFVFRLESGDAAASLVSAPAETTADGRVPVVYSLNLSDASSLFTMQDFQMRDGDVLYISTAPGVELERFLGTISSSAFSIIAVGNALDSNSTGN